jgi:hypothetical protein
MTFDHMGGHSKLAMQVFADLNQRVRGKQVTTFIFLVNDSERLWQKKFLCGKNIPI